MKFRKKELKNLRQIIFNIQPEGRNFESFIFYTHIAKCLDILTLSKTTFFYIK